MLGLTFLTKTVIHNTTRTLPHPSVCTKMMQLGPVRPQQESSDYFFSFVLVFYFLFANEISLKPQQRTFMLSLFQGQGRKTSTWRVDRSRTAASRLLVSAFPCAHVYKLHDDDRPNLPFAKNSGAPDDTFCKNCYVPKKKKKLRKKKERVRIVFKFDRGN